MTNGASLDRAAAATSRRHLLDVRQSATRTALAGLIGVSAWLIAQAGQDLAPAYYIVRLGALGLGLMCGMAETNERSLSD